MKARAGRFQLHVSWAVGVTAFVLVALAAWRSTLGMSFLDDAYYAAVTLRFAQGARLFADEMYVQSLGFLAAVPFAKAWVALFGTTGFVVALRLFYVALASAAALTMYRVLRPSFGCWAALAGAALPLLAPAYNLLAVSYDTMAVLGMLLGLTFAFKAVRDSSCASAVAAGGFAAFACVSYPPLVVGAAAMLLAFGLVARDRRLTGAMATGAGVTVVAFLAWLSTQASLADLMRTYAYGVGAYSVVGPGGRLGFQLGKLWLVLNRVWGLPIWAWSVPALFAGIAIAWLAVSHPEREGLRGWVAGLLPLAVALPIVPNWAALGGANVGTLGGNYLTAFVWFCLPGIAVGMWKGPASVRRLLALALPAGIAGFLIVSLSTSASLDRASGVVGLAPLVLASVVWWASEVRTLSRPALGVAAVLTLIVAGVALLFGSSFNDAPPLTLRHTIASGPCLGITTTDRLAGRVSAVERLTGKWVGPSTGVLVFGIPGPYMLQRGVMVTNAVFLHIGPVDQATIDYFDRIGRWPDVALVPADLITPAGSSSQTASADPLLAALASRYRVVERSPAARLVVMVPASSSAP
jgi:hypothetical protein